MKSMNNSQVTSRQHGLTLVQWGLLLFAFMAGLGGSLIIREVFPPAHAGVVQTAPSQAASSQSGALDAGTVR